MNSVVLVGNVTRDPELRQVGEHRVAKIGLAMNRRFKDKSGETKEDTTFVDVEAWDRQADFLEKFVKKGRLLWVTGELRPDNWEDKETGAKRSKLFVSANNINFVGPKPADGGGDSEPTEKPKAKSKPKSAPARETEEDDEEDGPLF